MTDGRHKRIHEKILIDTWRRFREEVISEQTRGRRERSGGENRVWRNVVPRRSDLA